MAASAPHTPITSSGDNFKYRGPQPVFFYLFLLLIFMTIKVIKLWWAHQSKTISITCWQSVESLFSSGAKKAIKKIGQGVGRGNKLYLRGICPLIRTKFFIMLRFFKHSVNTFKYPFKWSTLTWETLTTGNQQVLQYDFFAYAMDIYF